MPETKDETVKTPTRKRVPKEQGAVKEPVEEIVDPIKGQAGEVVPEEETTATDVITPEVLGVYKKMTPSGGEMRRWKAKDYIEFHKASGTPYGRKPGQKTPYTIEELRIHINTGWTRQMVMDKTGLKSQEIDRLLIKLQRAESRKRPIQFR